MPLANNLLNSPADECPRFPLKVMFCCECALAQLAESPSPNVMFDEYPYFSSQSRTMSEHAGKLVQHYVKPGDRVLEIASNDGYLLKQAMARGARVLGIDPARNIADFANGQGVPTRCDYFDTTSAAHIADEWGKADVIFANNVLAHVPDPNQIAQGIQIALAPHGIAHLEVPWLVRMIEMGAFDTIYHEHHCYFSLTSIKALFNRYALKVIGVDVIDIHGGSLHVQIAHAGDETQAIRFAHEEQMRGIIDDVFFTAFVERLRQMKFALTARLAEYETVVGYGAAAKATVLLNHFELGTQHVRWVADASPRKQGRFVPGTRQPIVHPRQLLRERPQAAILFPWNIAAELVTSNRQYLDDGGTFIVTIPEVRTFRANNTSSDSRCAFRKLTSPAAL